MNNTFGKALRITLFGESHGQEIGAVADGLPAGLSVEEDTINRQLSRRRGLPELSTARREPDHWRIVSGVYRGVTSGAPLCILIENRNARSEDYESALTVPRPGHADYAAHIACHGQEDPRGGGHFSGRLTAPLTALGAIIENALREKGIRIATHIARCAGLCDRDFSHIEQEADELASKDFPVLDDAVAEAMKQVIRDAADRHDSVGACLSTAVTGLPAGVGAPWADSVESVLSSLFFAIPAVKGVQFGDGFSFTDRRGSEVSDGWASAEGQTVTLANHNGGINGGLTNAMPLRFDIAVKPTPSIGLPQNSVDLTSGKPATLTVAGRHDPCIAPRAVPVVEAMTAFGLADLLCRRWGSEALRPDTKPWR